MNIGEAAHASAVSYRISRHDERITALPAH